jgi:1,2-diacylglycerol 3-beta-glucosyltransferase
MIAVGVALLSLAQVVLFACLLYQYLLAFASIPRPDTAAALPDCRKRFAVAIPAHNEAAVLCATLSQLREQDYDRDLYDVHIVADHCTDNTLEVARAGGAIAHERTDLPRGRKAYAVQWLVDRILAIDPPYDAVAVFDADSLVDPDFLRTVNNHLCVGARVLQGQHIISNPRDSCTAMVAAVDMRLNNLLRNQSRRNLGLPCRLMGDAMVFDSAVLREHGWLGRSMTEDREYGYELALRGIGVRYVPEAKSSGQAAGGWKQAEPQRLRWCRGLLEMQRHLTGRLIRGVLRFRSFMLLDRVIELLMPSFSFLTAASGLNLLLVGGFALARPAAHTFLGIWGSAVLVLGWFVYPLVGLVVDRAPHWAFRALLLGPLYLVWRLWISLLVRLRGDQIRWVRTRRREEID